MAAISEPHFTSPLRSQNMLTTHYYTITSTPPFASHERCQLFSPERNNGFPMTPCSPSLPWSSPESGGDLIKRGRPKAATLTSLISHGSTNNDSSIKCPTCGRIFPREKSLAAHMRTHTGERPYICDYPNCTKAFCQSGQLKTHQRLHSGEKPFICSVKSCNIRFTHANRHCPDHPNVALLRDDDNMPLPAVDESSTAPMVREWLSRYFSTRHERTPYKHRQALHSSSTKRSLFSSPESLPEQENADPLEDVATPKTKNRKQLFAPSTLATISLDANINDEHDQEIRTSCDGPRKRLLVESLTTEKTSIESDDTMKGALALLQLAKVFK
ncbi:hypothetical protein HELRODRAFT_185063 [Helobdella robusta]|uniref:C2H2-type domain-containing protein n=1 Tax=Helobdella robusta TaxID=6412 RepID=T1FMC5_HELRO|nr:hypothetical protein HELRODRAFT_185063 [Helobdella robusta]ESN96024.1 hypothetical protein HELRODRAFT_185063 [Helobdella robusta]